MYSPHRRFRYSFGELFIALVIGLMIGTYGFLAVALFGLCTCDGDVKPDPQAAVIVIQWGMACIGVWILAITVAVLRDRSG